MKRRDQGISQAWSVLLGFVLLTVVVPGVLIGPARAVRIIASAVSGTVMQGTSPVAVTTGEHQLPMVDIDLSEGHIVHEGVHYSMEVEQKEGNELMIRLHAPDNSPFGPYERITVSPPRTADMLGGSLALWVAGRMGVPVPYKELVYLRMDGDDAGVHEVTELVSEEFERYRHISDGPVEVMIAAHHDETGATVDPWRDVAHWRLMGEDRGAGRKLNELIGVLNDTIMDNAPRRQRLEEMIDVEAFIRSLSTLHVLGAEGHSGVRMAMVMNPRTDRYYPVLIAAPLVPIEQDGSPVREASLLSQRLMAIDDWRMQRDQMTRQALQELQAGEVFTQRLDRISAQVAPSLATAGKTSRALFSMRDPDHSAGALQWSSGDLRSRVTAHWDRLSMALAVEAPATHSPVP
jgi:hypothetical protein